MEYTIRNSSGDIGEHLVAFKFLKLFRWPCRLYGIDIGVDAEVEILDDKGHSHGDILKVQVKHSDKFADGDNFSVTTDERHIQYWTRFCVPLIFCAAESDTMNVYWRQITDFDDYDTTGNSKKVSFDRKQHALTAGCKERFRELVIPPQSRNIGERLAQIKVALDSLRAVPGDSETVHKYRESLKHTWSKIKEVEDIILHFPWRLPGTHKHLLEAIKQEWLRLHVHVDMAAKELFY